MHGARFKRPRGFTLIELMIVVAVISILAAIAIPKFADMIRRSQEGSTKASLGALRSALGIYYADNEGKYPGVPLVHNTGLYALTDNGKYLTDIPMMRTPSYHPDTSIELDAINSGVLFRNRINDNGGWYYDTDDGQVYIGGPASGGAMVYVNCTDTDSKGTAWSSY